MSSLIGIYGSMFLGATGSFIGSFAGLTLINSIHKLNPPKLAYMISIVSGSSIGTFGGIYTGYLISNSDKQKNN